MRTDAVIDQDIIADACQDLRVRGVKAAFEEIRQSEPDLAVFLEQAVKNVTSARKARYLEGLEQEISALAKAAVVSVVAVMQLGHRRLWRDAMGGTLLHHIDPAIQPKRAGVRRGRLAKTTDDLPDQQDAKRPDDTEATD
jgi:hypothetical protein